LYLSITTIVEFIVKNNSGNTVLAFQASNMNIIFNTSSSITKQVRLTFSIDLNDTSKRLVYANGVNITSFVTWSSYVNSLMDFTAPLYHIGDLTHVLNTFKYAGNIGELYFDTNYTDLSTNNPFWDAETNKPKPVRQVIRETGITPLIAMPLDASNAGKNYGTGGDFTANSAPYVGARGASEFWARSANFGTNLGNLSRTNVSNLATKTISFACAFKLNTSSLATARTLLLIENSLAGLGFRAEVQTNSTVRCVGLDSSGTTVANIGSSTAHSTQLWATILFSLDTSNTKATLIVNGNNETTTISLVTNALVDITGVAGIAREIGGANDFEGISSFFYFTTDYIDFSQEVNRLKFVDAFGYPKDLKAQIDAGVIPTPLIYLPFDDPTNLGKNLGSGGDFTVNGTVTQGADVLG
jgi:hypothetical protein